MIKTSDLTYEQFSEFTRQKWLAVYGAMVALQCQQYMLEGRGGDLEVVMAGFIEEAKEIADMQTDDWMLKK